MAVLLAVLVSPEVAAADRAPTTREASAIERVALKHCHAPPGDECEFRKGRISTPHARFAWADVVTEGLSGLLLKRPSRQSRRFKVIGIQGGGIGECDYWRARAPRAVLRDLHIGGLVDDSGTTRNCGKRR